MERFDSGGWISGNIQDPGFMGAGPDHGKGVWAQPPAADTGTNHGPPPAPGNPDFMTLVDGWHKTYLLPRQR